MSVVSEPRRGLRRLHTGASTLAPPLLDEVELDAEFVRHIAQAPTAMPARSAASRTAKRTLDYAIAVPMLILSLPVMLVAALAILAVDHHWPVFADARVGRDGRRFRCLKLRTMDRDPRILETYLAANPGECASYRATRKLRCDPRVTALGAFLRRTSLDELPQLFNVIAGDMSLVGPRPLGREEFEERGDAAIPLTFVRPGLTGAWQVKGRSDLSLDHRMTLDNEYALGWSPWTDLRIILATPLAVVRGTGAR